MAYLSLSVYKKSVEMFDLNCTRGFIMTELDLDAQQYAECLKLYIALKGQREKKPKKTKEEINRDYYESHKKKIAREVSTPHSRGRAVHGKDFKRHQV